MKPPKQYIVSIRSILYRIDVEEEEKKKQIYMKPIPIITNHIAKLGNKACWREEQKNNKPEFVLFFAQKYDTQYIQSKL